jgi:hypothetical protein
VKGRNIAIGLVIVVAIFIAVLEGLRTPERNTGDPVVVAKNFIGLIELGQYPQARALLELPTKPNGQVDPVLTDKVDAMLRNMHNNIDQSAIDVKLLSRSNDTADVQIIRNDPQAVLHLKNIKGHWIIVLG